MISQMTRRQFLTGASGVVALASGYRGGDLAANAAEDRHARIAIAIRGTQFSLGWIGTEAGIFKRLGIDVTFPAIETGAQVARTGLDQGHWDFVEIAEPPIVLNVIQGRDSVILLTVLPSGKELSFLMARRGITEPAHLVGARIGIVSEEGGTGIIVRGMLQQWGITAKLVALGSFPKIYAALGAQDIDAGWLGADYRIAGQRSLGLTALSAPGEGLHIQSSLNCTRRLIRSDRELVARVVRGYVETIHLFKTQPEVVVPLLQRYLQLFDLETVREIREYYAPHFQKVPVPSRAVIQNLLSNYASQYPEARALAPNAVTDTSFIEELERNGFIARLYGG